MNRRSRNPWRYGLAVLCAVTGAISVGAAQITTTDRAMTDGAGMRTEISVDAATLDHYVGKYRVGSSNNILAITREGSQLSAQITGQPLLPIYPETATTFFWKAVDAQLTFTVGANGLAASATIHQLGHDIAATRLTEAAAQVLEQQLAVRVSQQLPQSGSEAALRKSIAAIQTGAPDYDDMTPLLQDATRRQLPALGPVLKERGPIQTVEFKGVGQNGADQYIVTYQNGKQSQCYISLNSAGKIEGLLLQPRL